MTEYCPLIGEQYPVRRGQQLNTQFTRPFPPCGSGLARETKHKECAWNCLAALPRGIQICVGTVHAFIHHCAGGLLTTNV